MSGWHRYYTEQELKAMYGSHDPYVAKVREVIESSGCRRLRAGDDASAALRDAARSTVAK